MGWGGGGGGKEGGRESGERYRLGTHISSGKTQAYLLESPFQSTIRAVWRRDYF